MKPALLLLIIGCSLLGGCRPEPPAVSLSPSSEAIRGHDLASYKNVLWQWTRHGRIIKGLDTTLRLSATLYSPAFTSAYLSRRAHLFQLTSKEKNDLTRKLEEENASTYSFFFSAATMDERWNDFNRKESIWHASLLNDHQEQVLPLEIHETTKITPTITEFFPYVDMFHHIYLTRFPKILSDGRPLIRPETKQVILRFAGPLGQIDLVWRLK